MTSDAIGRERASIDRDLASPDEEMRRLAMERVLMLPAAEAIPRLIDGLGDTSWRVRKSAIERLASCSESQPVLEGLIVALADGENPGRRNAAVEALVARGVAATPALVAALESDDVDVRKLLVDTMTGIGDESAREPLIEMLCDADANVRAATADALAVIGGEGVADALYERAIRIDEDSLVRLSALRALARLEAPLAPRDLAPVLDDAVLRPAALTLLGHLDGDDAVEFLLKGLESGARSSREAAMESLLRVISRADGSPVDALCESIRALARGHDLLVESAIERLADADLASKLVLIQFLGLLRDPRSVVPILRAGRDEAIHELAHATLESMGAAAEAALDDCWDDLDVDLRRDACRLMSRTRGERGTARLLAALEDPTGELCSAAARALGARCCADALPALVRRLEMAALEAEAARDGEADEELDAFVDALVELAGPAGMSDPSLTEQAIGLLSARLDGAAERVRLSIASVIGRIGRSQEAELVAALLKDPSARVRRAAVEAVARLEPGAVSERLRLALADESPDVRIAAASALGMSSSEHVLDDLQRLLHDEDARVRAAGMRAIGDHSSRAPSPSHQDDAVRLIEHALAGDAYVAMAAVEALCEIGGPQAAASAARVLDRGEAELVQIAVQCIGEHGDEATVAELLSLVGHPSWWVRADVVQTLADRRVRQAVPPILRRLETEQDTFVRETILRALKQLEE